MLRCALCGRPAGDNPEARAKEEQARLRAKETHAPVKAVWICPVCSGRARYEAEETGHGLKRKDKPPM